MKNHQIFSELNQRSSTNFHVGMHMSDHEKTTRPIKFIRPKVAIERIGLSRSEFMERIRPGSPKFDELAPERIYLNGTPGKGPVAFIEEDFNRWLASLAEKSLSKKGATV